MNYQRLQIANGIARKMFKNYHGKFPEEIRRRDLYHPSVEGIFGLYRKTKVPCSKWCCGNPRRHFGELTVQERKANISFEEQII